LDIAKPCSVGAKAYSYAKQIAISSIGAAYHCQQVQTDLHPYCFRCTRPAEPDPARTQQCKSFSLKYAERLNRFDLSRGHDRCSSRRSLIRCRSYGADRNDRTVAIKMLLLRSICCLSHGSNSRGQRQKIAPPGEALGPWKCPNSRDARACTFVCFQVGTCSDMSTDREATSSRPINIRLDYGAARFQEVRDPRRSRVLGFRRATELVEVSIESLCGVGRASPTGISSSGEILTPKRAKLRQ
jgi:hypothetical protein